MNCCASARQVGRLQKELNLWKQRYFVEKKFRKVIENWSVQVFGFDIKVEYDKSTSMVKIQAIENKEAMKTAAISNESSDSCLRVVVMDVKLSCDDFFEDGDDMVQVDPIPVEINSNQIIHTTSTGGKIGQIVDNGQIINAANVSNQQHLQTSQNVIEIPSSPIQGNSEVMYLVTNYDDGSGSGENKLFIISKPGENEEFDYPQYVSDAGSVGEKQVYYRIATPSETANEHPPPSPSPVIEIVKSPPKPAKRKYPATKHSGAKAPKVKKLSQSKVTNNTVIVNAEHDGNTEDNASIVIAVTSSSPIATPEKESLMISKKKYNEEKPYNSRTQPPLEFGLTLREQSEIYVRTKAKEAIRKVGSGYECTLCPDVHYFYSSLENAITHTKAHFESKPYKCEHCEETFGIQRELFQHKKTVHPKNKGLPAKPTSLHSVGQPLHQIPPSGSKSATTTVVVTTNSTINEAKKKINCVGTKPTIKASVPPSKATKNQFKCQVNGCSWSYPTAQQLSWHMKAHSQARV